MKKTMVKKTMHRRRKVMRQKGAAPVKNEIRNSDSKLSGKESLISVRMNPFPERFKCCLKFSEQVGWSGGASVNEIHYRANGAYDPRYAVGGGSCRYFTEMAALYSNYIVTGCKYKVSNLNTSASTCWLFTDVGSGALSFGSLDDLFEQPDSRKVQCTYGNNNGSYKSLSGFINPAKVIGNTNQQYYINTEATGATTTSNPTVQAILYIAVASIDASNVSGFCRIELCYDIEFFNRKV
ncbi:MAG: putative capsid protein [Cressdnaviricota sp.]|nr:MAG: putative capsid protein [Cressdnaviricota sp.]